jgi:hypothetical protein
LNVNALVVIAVGIASANCGSSSCPGVSSGQATILLSLPQIGSQILSVARGTPANTQVHVQWCNYAGTRPNVALATPDLPAHVASGFSQTVVTPAAGDAADSTLTLNADQNAAPGAQLIKIDGSVAGQVMNSTTLTVTIE